MTMTAERLETIDCPLCRSAFSREWARENGFRAVKCLDCGLVYVNPRPLATEIDDATRLGAHPLLDGAQLDVKARPSLAKPLFYADVVRGLFQEERSAGRPIAWLDVGAGYGEMIAALRRVMPKGSVLKGIEPMEAKAARARALGFDVQACRLADVTERYDVVSLINVFSHVPDFDHFLEEVQGVLRPGGMLLPETGNGGELMRRIEYPGALDLPDHLVFAGSMHIATYLERRGFTVLAVEKRRMDTAADCTRIAMGALRRGRIDVRIPYASAFRTIFVKAALGNSH